MAARATGPHAGQRTADAALRHPTADRMLVAAERLVIQGGLEALTLEAVASASGTNKASTRYYFGSKRALIEALFEAIVARARFVDEIAGAEWRPAEMHRSRLAERIEAVAVRDNCCRSLLALLDYMVHDNQLCAKAKLLSQQWYESYGDGCVSDGPPRSQAQPTERSLGQFVVALAMGVAVQSLVHGSEFDPSPVLDVLDCLLDRNRRDYEHSE